MDFVENDEPVFEVLEEERWAGEAGAVITVFKIKVEGVACFADLKRSRRLADLAWPNQRDGCPTISSMPCSRKRPSSTFLH